MDRGVAVGEPWRPDPTVRSDLFKPPETPKEPMEFLSRSWSVSALEVSKALTPSKLIFPKGSGSGGGGGGGDGTILEDVAEEVAAVVSNPFSFASSETSQLIMERNMSQSEIVHGFCSMLELGKWVLLKNHELWTSGYDYVTSPFSRPQRIDCLQIGTSRKLWDSRGE